jgi:hypothetical protein
MGHLLTDSFVNRVESSVSLPPRLTTSARKTLASTPTAATARTKHRLSKPVTVRVIKHRLSKPVTVRVIGKNNQPTAGPSSSLYLLFVFGGPLSTALDTQVALSK